MTVKISVSNIAWDPEEDEQVASLLKRYGIEAIDVAPPKYFSDVAAASDTDVARVRQKWADRGFRIVGMQALMFGTTGLNIFGGQASQQSMLEHLEHVARIGAGLGGHRLVFGSPRNRDRQGLSDAEAEAIASDFFGRLGDIAARYGVVFCVEPNPAAYNCNFLTTTRETARFVRSLAHPAIKMQLDLGALSMNDEDPRVVMPEVATSVGHIHISEPNLVPVGDLGSDHRWLAQSLNANGFAGAWATIEMVATKNEPHLVAIERACQVVVAAYGSGAEGGAA